MPGLVCECARLDYAQWVARATELCIRSNDTSLRTERGVPRKGGTGNPHATNKGPLLCGEMGCSLYQYGVRRLGRGESGIMINGALSHFVMYMASEEHDASS